MEQNEKVLHDKPSEQKPDEVTRRESFIKLGLGSLTVAGCGATVFSYAP